MFSLRLWFTTLTVTVYNPAKRLSMPENSAKSIVFDDPRPELDRERCATVGASLARGREERSLSVADVSRRLLLSTRQVRALETVEPAAFHNTTFYLAALKKYAALCDLDPEAVAADVVVPPRIDEAQEIPIEETPGLVAGSKRWGAAAAIVIACAGVGLGVGLVRMRGQAPSADRQRSAAVAPAPAFSPDVGAPTLPPETAVSPATLYSSSTGRDAAVTPAPTRTVVPAGDANVARATGDEGADTSSGYYGWVRLPRAAWMFLRRSDNTVIERTVAAGETVELHTRPRYLALGSAEAELIIGARAVDTSPFISKGTLRMGVADFSAAEEITVAEPGEVNPDDSDR